MYKRYLKDFDVIPVNNYWSDVKMTGFSENKVYVVQTGQKVVQRCILMATDPGDLVLDPTCGSGTTANVAEQWGRRWITIDTSRVALALARNISRDVIFDIHITYLPTAGRGGRRRRSLQENPRWTVRPTAICVRALSYDRVSARHAEKHSK